MSAPEPPRSVLITRPRPGAAETARRVAGLGFAPVIAPLFCIHRLAPAVPAGADAVLVTSGNAVSSLPEWARQRPIFAVGEATAALVRQADFPNVHTGDGDAAALAHLVRRSLPGGSRVLLLTGKGQGGRLATMLRDHAGQVTCCEVYEAVPVERLPDAALESLEAGSLVAALFFSTETARCAVRLITRAELQHAVGTIIACAIGPPAGMALESLQWRQIRIAARPTQDEMLALLR